MPCPLQGPKIRLHSFTCDGGEADPVSWLQHTVQVEEVSVGNCWGMESSVYAVVEAARRARAQRCVLAGVPRRLLAASILPEPTAASWRLHSLVVRLSGRQAYRPQVRPDVVEAVHTPLGGGGSILNRCLL